MKALILAAGLGSRLSHFTQDDPKALLKINYKPILHYQLESLIDLNITDIAIVTGYRKEKIYSFLNKNSYDCNFHFYENLDYEITNSAYSLWMAKEFIENNHYVHLNCDILFSKKILSKIIKSQHSNAICLSKYVELKNNMEMVELDSKDKIIDMNNYYTNSNFIAKAYGLSKISPEVTNFNLLQIENLISKNNLNENFYGILRSAVDFFDFYGIFSLQKDIYEFNTIRDFDKYRAL